MTAAAARAGTASLDAEVQPLGTRLRNGLDQTRAGRPPHPWPSPGALELWATSIVSAPSRRLDPRWLDALIRAGAVLYARALEGTIGQAGLARLAGRSHVRTSAAERTRGDRTPWRQRTSAAAGADRLWEPWRPIHDRPPAVAGWPEIRDRVLRIWIGGRDDEGRNGPGWSRRIRRIAACEAHAAEYTACQGDLRFRPLPCGSFVCQRCMRTARARQVKVARELLKTTFQHRPRMLTLTLPSRDNLPSMRDEMNRAWSKLRRSKLWRARVRGGFCVEEFEWREGSGAHLHRHAAVDSVFLPINRLVVEWQKAVGCRCHRTPGARDPELCAFTEGWEIRNDGKASHARYGWARPNDRCPGRHGGMPSPAGQSIDVGHDALERELAKYLSKGFMGGAAAWPAWVLADVLQTWWGRPRMTRFGVCHGVALDACKDPGMPVHEVCGASCWEWTGTVPFSVYRAWAEHQRERSPP